jgi:hypothetical protein
MIHFYYHFDTLKFYWGDLYLVSSFMYLTTYYETFYKIDFITFILHYGKTATNNFYISIVNATRCTNFSNLFYFWDNNLHVSDRFSVHHQDFKTVHTATSICQTGNAVYLLASRQQYLFDIDLLLYVVLNLIMDGKTVLNMFSVNPKIKKIWEVGASCWICYRNILRCMVLWMSKLQINSCNTQIQCIDKFQGRFLS